MQCSLSSFVLLMSSVAEKDNKLRGSLLPFNVFSSVTEDDGELRSWLVVVIDYFFFCIFF
jgi:hypothetical protein